MTLSELRSSICMIFWAYFLIYVDLNLGPLNILPAWAGYLLLFPLLNTLSAEQPTMKLLLPFAPVLAADAAYSWLDQLTGGGLPALPGWLSLALGLIAMYFHFQLFTDLAALARRRGVGSVSDGTGARNDRMQGPPRPCQVKGLLAARTVQTLLNTALLIEPLMSWLERRDGPLAILVIAVYLAVLIVILSRLYALRRLFPAARPAPAA